MYKADKRYCLNADRSKVVDCDSTEATFMLVAEGGEITDEDAARYGLTKKTAKAAAEAEPASDKPEEKARHNAPENKAVVMTEAMSTGSKK